MTDQDRASGPHLHTYQFGEGEATIERLVFSYRPLLLFVFFLATVFFAYQTAGLRPVSLTPVHRRAANDVTSPP